VTLSDTTHARHRTSEPRGHEQEIAQKELVCVVRKEQAEDARIRARHPEEPAGRMILLEAEKIDFKISTTWLSLSYSEGGEARIEVEGLRLENLHSGAYERFAIVFDLVAEITCVSLYFYESNYNDFELLPVCRKDEELSFWRENQFCPDSGFYRFEDSSESKDRMRQYDPKGRLGLKRFLVVGNDSYVKIVARGYRIEGGAPV
jgi:hypothetical protein